MIVNYTVSGNFKSVHMTLLIIINNYIPTIIGLFRADKLATVNSAGDIYPEGSCCPLEEFGDSREGKKSDSQVNIGLLCDGLWQ